MHFGRLPKRFVRLLLRREREATVATEAIDWLAGWRVAQNRIVPLYSLSREPTWLFIQLGEGDIFLVLAQLFLSEIQIWPETEVVVILAVWVLGFEYAA